MNRKWWAVRNTTRFMPLRMYNIYSGLLPTLVFSGRMFVHLFPNTLTVACFDRQSELHKNCSSVSELATVASASGQQPPLPSLHTGVDCGWKPFGRYLLQSSP